jgi:hypothetical protein
VDYPLGGLGLQIKAHYGRAMMVAGVVLFLLRSSSMER